MAKTSTPRTIQDQWECQLGISPSRVDKGDKVTFTVTLSHPIIGAIDAAADAGIQRLLQSLHL